MSDADRPDDEVVPSEVLTPADDPLAALGGAGGFDMGSMMQMAQDMAGAMGAAQAALDDAEVEGTAGGGLVGVTIDGHLNLLRVSIDAAAIDPEDLSMLEDLVVAAWNDAAEKARRLQAELDPLGGLGGSGLGGAGGLGGLLGGGLSGGG